MGFSTGGAAYETIIDWVEPGSSVLELGCGSGGLLSRLVKERNVKAQGIEIDDASISLCVQKGLNVLHEQVDTALGDYADNSFDFAIFDRSLQRVVRRPDIVLMEALRISRNAIVGFSNFAHYPGRCQVFFRGRTPVTPSLPYQWHDTPNLHFLSIADFTDYCHSKNIRIEKVAFFGGTGTIRLLPNLRALAGFFLISKRLEPDENSQGGSDESDRDS